MEAGTEKIEIFISYAREDQKLLGRLKKHLSPLKRAGRITSWYDGDISAGKQWADEIDKHLNMAHIILLLVSPDFIDSDYCQSVEIKRAMERHTAGEALVIPVILRPINWLGELFGRLQALPANAIPVTLWKNQDEAFRLVADGIQKVIDEMHTKRSDILPSSATEEESAADVDEEVPKATEEAVTPTSSMSANGYVVIEKKGPAMVGQQLRDYRLITLLGQGSFANVYLGEHIHLGRRAAIKVLRTQLSENDVEQFSHEAKTIASLDHPNIVKVLEFGFADHQQGFSQKVKRTHVE